MKARGKRVQADVISYCKMTSVMAKDSVASFYAGKTLHVNICDTVQLLAGFPQYNGGRLGEAENFKCIFVVYCVLELK